jgi:hypothetical protein
MAVRDISKAEVRESVRVNCSHGFKQSNGTWIYQGSSFVPVVVLNGKGTVVTTWWAGSGGGGGGGGGGDW